ncbi:PGF-pre-PGF domain-containing protein [Methanoregula sp.]|uniref:PGF-pre-PGF domain-containing protein n=1 Tax=Methanoregula sp. TaxID=2052170 RepID=UPI002375AD22|nr:PGF-pre-PGF domain-containing protein [Methanoregula sp.]MDD1687319.1 PGF-pre-PGF domain-containing protein [Methanoregula sp.]
MRDVLAALILIALLSSVPVADAATSLVITQPSANETSFAEMRDFYVYGVFSPVAVSPGDFSIELYQESACTGDTCSGSPVRAVRSHVDPVTLVTNASQIDWSFVDGSTVKGGYVPDIIKTDTGGGGLNDPNNKVVVTHSYYAGLIQGGVTQDYNTTYKGSNGVKLQNITDGDYRIKVIGLSGEFSGQTVTKSIHFGITDTAFGTNRPTSNKNVRTSYAIEHGLRTYYDAFPGYFDGGNGNWSNFKKLSAPNNGIESVNDLYGTTKDTVAVSNNTMFIYNLNSASTTYCVELAPILKFGLEDGVNTTFLYYSNGEPVLTYRDSGGTSQEMTSTLKQFSGSTRLGLTRVDVRNATASSYENLYDPNDTVSKWVYTDLSGTISMNEGQYFTIYGVTKPIAATVSSTSTPYWYSFDNRIANLTCTITDAYGNTVSTTTHAVNLSRYYNNYPGSWNPYQKYNSLFEFGAEITSRLPPGLYTVSLAGADVSGSAVSGATGSFSLQVKSLTSTDTAMSGVDSGSSDSSSAGAPQVLISPGAPTGQPVAFTFTSGASDRITIQAVTLTPARAIGQVECILRSAAPGPALQLNDRAVAGYHSITVNWISPDAIDHAEIAFSVDKSWLEAHHVAPENVVMLRYTNNQWVELPTRLDQTSARSYGYIATTPGFSYFAVAEKKNGAVGRLVTHVPTVPVTEVPSAASNAASGTSSVYPTRPLVKAVSTTTIPALSLPVVTPAQSSIMLVFFPSEGLPFVTILVWVVVLVILIMAIWLIRRWWIRRQNPALFRNYD